MKNDNELSFELLFEKFQFHNTSIHFHAELAKRIGDLIREEYSEQARESNYFTEEFFSENNKAESEEDNSVVAGDPQTSDSALAQH